MAINKARLIQTIQNLFEAEKEQNRRNLEAIFRSVNDAIITVDKNMQIIAANDATREICGMDPKEIVGKKFQKVTRYCAQSCYEALNEILGTGKTIKDYRLECHKQTRPHQIVAVSSSPLRDSADKNIGTVLVIRDLTRVAEMEGELRERYNLHNIVGKSHQLQRIFHLLDELMNTDTTVLITGETGTGKELVAKALHYGGAAGRQTHGHRELFSLGGEFAGERIVWACERCFYRGLEGPGGPLPGSPWGHLIPG